MSRDPGAITFHFPSSLSSYVRKLEMKGGETASVNMFTPKKNHKVRILQLKVGMKVLSN